MNLRTEGVGKFLNNEIKPGWKDNKARRDFRYHPLYRKRNLVLSEDTFHVLLKEGIAAAKGGSISRAYQLLQKATNINPDNELGWLWLAGVSKSPQESLKYLKRVLAINPDNEHAISGLKWVHAKMAEVQEKQEPEKKSGWNCPLCLTSFPEQLPVCRSCGAVLTLSDMDAILHNNGANKPIIIEAIERLNREIENKSQFHTHYILALAYLNINQINDGIMQLRKALAYQPEDHFLKTRIEELSILEPTDTEPVVQGKTVLAVDDSPIIRRLVKITLEREGYRIITAADGQEGLAKVISEMPDLVMLDISMPNMNGYQLCETIKTNQLTANIPVIMLSGRDEAADREMGRKVGSSGYIIKPFEPDELVMYVRTYINHADDGETENSGASPGMIM
jgi:twitching motility two-component system response regulator PilG